MSEVRHATDPVSGKRVEIRDDLVKRLRGLYARGPTLPNGEPEFGWRQIGLPAAIQLEAATEIERLRKEMERILLETTDDTTRADLQAVLDHK